MHRIFSRLTPLLLLTLWAVAGTGDGYELRFPLEASHAHAVLVPLRPLDLTKFTLHFEVRLRNRTDYPFLVSYAVRGQPNEFAVWVPGDEKEKHYGLIIKGNQFGVKVDTPFPVASENNGAWIPVTVIWNGDTGFTQLVVNRTVYFPNHHPYKHLFTERLQGGGRFIIGQEQDHFDKLLFDRNQRLVGSVRDLKLWSRVLSKNEFGSLWKVSPWRIGAPDVFDFPLIDIRDGAEADGAVGRCHGADEGFAFEGEFAWASNESDAAGCGTACEESAVAKAWTLTSRGECRCFKTVTGVQRNRPGDDGKTTFPVW